MVTLKQIFITVIILRRIALLAMVLVFSACTKQEKGHRGEEVAAYYEKAAIHAGNHEYEKALELLQKGLAKDTLGGFSQRTADALNRKGTIEAVTGKYFDALASHDVIEQRCQGMLPEAVEAERIRSKATLLAELGDFAGAEKSLINIAALSARDSLSLARYRTQAGEPEKAFDLYSDLCVNADRVIALEAYTGLLEMSLEASFGKIAPPSVYAHRITGLARKIVAEKKEGNKRDEALALRRAAILLELLPAHAENASYLFFKALSRARGTGDERLIQLLDFESNAVLANNPEVYARTLDYFERNNMPLARAVALLKKGIRGKTEDSDKIRALKQGLSVYQYQVAPMPGYAIVNLLDRSTEKLTELLLSKGRYAEVFENDELKKLHVLKQAVQRGYDSFELPEEHEKLERQVIKLGNELNALLQRLMNCFKTGCGYEGHATTIDAINKKRGMLYEKLAEVRSVSPLQAEKLTVSPVTLQTVQQKLDEGHAVLKIIVGQQWCTVFLVQNSYVDVSRRKVNAKIYRSRLQLFREHLAMDEKADSEWIAADSARLWLTDLLIKPYSGRLRDVSRLTVIADDPVPAHLLGSNDFLFHDFPVSWIYSANELVRPVSPEDGSGGEQVLTFYSVDDYQDALEQKLAFPHHAVFLLWRHFSDSEIEEMRILFALSLQQGGDPSDVLHQLAKNRQAESNQWFYLSEYGTSGK